MRRIAVTGPARSDLLDIRKYTVNRISPKNISSNRRKVFTKELGGKQLERASASHTIPTVLTYILASV